MMEKSYTPETYALLIDTYMREGDPVEKDRLFHAN